MNFFMIKIFLNYSELHASVGVALATLFSWILYFLGGVVILRNKINVEFKFRLFSGPLIAGGIMAGFLYLFNHYSPEMNLLKGAAEILGGAVIYFLVLILLKEISKEDIDLIKNLFTKQRTVGARKGTSGLKYLNL